jgi:hypothetical protein
MRNPTPLVSPPPASPGYSPDEQTLAELGAIYSAVAFADGDVDPLSEQVAPGRFDEEAIDEAIFAGMVAMR